MIFMTRKNGALLGLAACLLLGNVAALGTDTPVTIYTPEGQSVTAYIMGDGTPWYTDEEAQDDIDYYGLDAEIIESATAYYNCHGYAWAKSENLGTYWIGYVNNDEEVKFFTDGSYSNDGQPSYVSASPSEATHGCYEQYSDHSIRVIQNGYPIGSSGYRTHVSKWGSGPLVRHQPGHDVFALKNTGIISYYRLRTTHYGSLSSYPKRWIGAGGKTHTITGNVTIPSNQTLTVLPSASVDFNTYYVDQNGGTFSIQSGSTVYLTNGSNRYYGLFTSVQSAINAASSGKTVQLLSGSYSESPSFSSRSSITLMGQGPGSSTLDGSISITNSSCITVSDLSMSGPLVANNNYFTHLDNVAISGSTVASVYYGSMNEFGWVTANNLGASFGLQAYGGSGDLYYSALSNADCGAYLTNYASYNIGTNNTFCENGCDIDAEAGGYAYAISNLYSRTLPSSIYGNVFVTGQNGVCGMAKPSSDPAVGVGGAAQLASPEIKELDDMYLALLRMIRVDRQAGAYESSKYHQYYLHLIDGYKGLVTEDANSVSIVAALSKLSQLYDGLGDRSAFRAYVLQQLTGGKFTSAQSCFRRYLIWGHVDKEEYDLALSVADEVLSSKDCGEKLAAEMLFEKGLVYKYYLGDLASARKMYDDLAIRYPSSPLVSLSNAGVGGSFHMPGAKSNETWSDLQNQDLDLRSYPNPFNPICYLTYALREPSEVSLAVYDVLGRCITQLAQGPMEVGKHTASWDASGFGSGVYYARLTIAGNSAKPTVQVRKLLLVK
jgi:hypothetical protein